VAAHTLAVGPTQSTSSMLDDGQKAGQLRARGPAIRSSTQWSSMMCPHNLLNNLWRCGECPTASR